MPVGFVVSGAHLEVVLIGAFTPREAGAALEAGLRASKARTVRLMIDAAQATILATPERIHAVAGALQDLGPRVAPHCALVVADEAHVKAVAAVGEIVASKGIAVRAFTDRQIAREWLDQWERGH